MERRGYGEDHNANDNYDDDDDTSECTVSCVDNDDMQGGGPIFSDSE
jgi:hypothetical protein